MLTPPSTICRSSRRRVVALGLTLALSLAATGCLHRHRRAISLPPQPPPAAPTPAPAPAPAAPIVQGQEGIASWYGHPFNGRPTASGEIYDMHAMTAAHRTLPFGTRVRVEDLENHRSVVVRINDRGPFVRGRIIDLSYAAAQAMHMPGTALVRLEILGYGAQAASAPPPGVFAVQVGAFKNPDNAERLKERIERYYHPVVVQTFESGEGTFHRVRVGQEPSEDSARQLAHHLRELNLATVTYVVRLN